MYFSNIDSWLDIDTIIQYQEFLTESLLLQMIFEQFLACPPLQDNSSYFRWLKMSAGAALLEFATKNLSILDQLWKVKARSSL